MMKPNITVFLERRRPRRVVAEAKKLTSAEPAQWRDLMQVPQPQRSEKLGITVLAENCPKSKSKK